MLGTYALYKNEHDFYTARPFSGNSLRVLEETNCDYYMTIDTNGIAVHARKDKQALKELLIHCPKCRAFLIRKHSAFNNTRTQVFQCIICHLKP